METRRTNRRVSMILWVQVISDFFFPVFFRHCSKLKMNRMLVLPLELRLNRLQSWQNLMRESL